VKLLRVFIREAIQGRVTIHHLDIYEGAKRALVWAQMEGFNDSKYGKGLDNFYAMPEGFDPNSVVGYVKVYTAGGAAGTRRVSFGSSLNVDERFRRQGIATAMYRYIEQDLGIELSPENMQEPDGKAFWSTKKWRA
jgi:ribosomal protein S18 acetylase RimI-like enzyme